MKEFGIEQELEINKVYISLGSNLGNRKQNLKKSLLLIDKKIGNIFKLSNIYQSEPWGLKNQNYFLNQVIIVDTNHDPFKLIDLCKNIELLMGRKHIKKWGPRNIDIDILYFNNEIINNKNLKIPHPEIHKRRFVLKPLNELDKNYIHPVHNISNLELLKNCNDELFVKLFS